MVLMTRQKTLLVVIIVFVLGLTALGLLYRYSKENVRFVSSDERRDIVSTELSVALERYYDEHGRYPNVETNEELLRVLSEKKYFENNVRLNGVHYVPVNSGQTYTLESGR
jgi:hypothetical protein